MNTKIDDLPLIMDIGMNNGRDSLFYLRKGFRVVAVEANPILVKNAQQQLADYIASGQLIIEPLGLGLEGQCTFYVTTQPPPTSKGGLENTKSKR